MTYRRPMFGAKIWSFFSRGMNVTAALGGPAQQFQRPVLFIILFKMVGTLKSNKILKGDHSIKTLSCGVVCYAVQGGSYFQVWIQMKAPWSKIFLWCRCLCSKTRSGVVRTF